MSIHLNRIKIYRFRTAYPIIPDIYNIKEKTHIIHPTKYRKDDDSSLCSHSKKDKEPIDTYNLLFK